MTGGHKWFSSGFLSICIFLIWIFLNTSTSFYHCYDVQFDTGGVWMMILKSTCCQLMKVKDFESLGIRFKVWSTQRPAPMLRCSWSVIWNNVELFQITWNNTVMMWIIPLPIVHMVSWWAQELELYKPSVPAPDHYCHRSSCQAPLYALRGFLVLIITSYNNKGFYFFCTISLNL